MRILNRVFLNTFQACFRRFVHQIPTIYALSTPPGTSAVAIVRISGPNACKVRQTSINLEQTDHLLTTNIR